MRLSTLALPAAAVALLLSHPARADRWSRHCRGPGEQEVRLVDGTYDGRWEEVLVIHGGGGLPMTQTFTATGTFRLVVAGADGREPTLEGELTTSSHAGLPGPGARGDQRAQGHAKLTLAGTLTERSFHAEGEHTMSRVVTVTHPFGQTARNEQPLHDHVRVDFTIERADCVSAEGEVRTETLRGMANQARASGARVELAPARFTLTRVEDPSDRLARFRAELERAPAPGIVYRRSSESERLGKLADSLKDEPKDLQECLWSMWMTYVRRRLAEWVHEDTVALRGYHGDFGGLDSLLTRAFDADRQLSVVGLDTCSNVTHEELWDAVAAATGDHLDRVLERDGSIADLVRALRTASLLGVVSPELRETCWDALRSKTEKWADVTWKAYRRALKAAGGDREAPAVRDAFAKALNAERQAVLLGSTRRRVLYETER